MFLVSFRGILLPLALTGVVSATPVSAVELFGRCIIGPCESAAGKDAINFIDPKRYAVTFVAEGTDAGVEDALKAASALWQGRNEAVGGSAGLLARAQGDYRRLLAALYNEGRYGGSISIEINGMEAADVAIGTELGATSEIAIRIDPGPAYVFGRADVEGAAPPTLDDRDKVEAFEDAGFAPGAPARADTVRVTSQLAREGWRQQGHPTAKVTSRTATANHPDRQLDVVLSVEAGPQATYGPVTVEGTERMDAAFVARHTGLVPGETFDPDDIERAKKRLERLGVFGSQSITEAETVEADGTLPLKIVVDERKLRRLGLGGTVSSSEGVGIETFWLHRNLAGKAEQLRLDASVSGLGATVDYRQFNYQLGAAFTRPGVFTPDTDFRANLLAKREVNESFTETSGGGTVSLSHLYSDELSVSAGVFAQYGRFEDDRGTRDFVTAGLDFSTIYDTREDKLDATRGFYASANLKPFYEFNFANPAMQGELEGRAYLPLDDEERIVLAGRVRLGSIIGPDVSEIPDNLLFFSGGGGSVRGYGFKGIGVVADDGSVSGGKSRIEASAEVRLRATERFGGVLFVDTAMVSANTVPDFDQDLRVGVGAGVRYYTGLGPIRLDVAVPLNRGEGDPSFSFYAGIGQAF